MGKGRKDLPWVSRTGEVVSLHGETWIVRAVRWGDSSGAICAMGFAHGGRQAVTARAGWLEDLAWAPLLMAPIPALQWRLTLTCPGGDGARFDSALVRSVLVPGAMWCQGAPVRATADGVSVGLARPLQIVACNWRAIVMPLAEEGWR